MKVNNRCVENKKIVYWIQNVFSAFHESYLTDTKHKTFEGTKLS